MCNPTPLRNWLISILAAILAAAGFVAVAAVTNGSFWLAWQSPGWMLAAAAATGGGVVLCGAALTALDGLCKCTGERCAGPCSNMRNTINAVRVVLGIQAAACLSTAAYAWIPWAAQPSMWAIGGALAVQAALIISAIAFFATLANCARGSR